MTGRRREGRRAGSVAARRIFVAYPYRPVGRALAECEIVPFLINAGFEPIKGPFSGACVVASIRNAIESCAGLIAVLPGGSPNVFFEIGLASALGKPCLLIADSRSELAMLDGVHPSIIDFDNSSGRWKLETVLEGWRRDRPSVSDDAPVASTGSPS